MTSFAIILVCLSALLHAIRDFFTKQSNDKQIFVWWYQVFSIIFYFPLFVYFILVEGVPSFMALVMGVVSGFIHFFYWIFLSKAYEKGDLSHVYPIMRSAPALVLVFSIIFLKEQVSLLGVIGILSVAFGVYIINLKSMRLHDLLEPITSIAKERPVRYAFLTLLAVTAYSLVDKIGVSYAAPIIFSYLLALFAFAFYTPYILATKKISAIKNEWHKNKKIIMWNGFLVMTSYSLILFVFTFSKLSYVVGLRQMSVVFAVVLGSYLLKEKHTFIRLPAAIVIFIGIFLISIAS